MSNKGAEPETSKQGLRILVVEDESLVAMMIEDMLTDLGHHVIATSGSMSKAGTRVSEISADLAILDVNLNGEETYPLAASLARRGIPFIFATGYGSSGIKTEWSSALVLQKPFQARELAKAIADAMRK